MDGNWEFSAAEAAAQKDPAKRDHFAYGVGRRICPGIHVAENSLFLLVSRVLWGFNIGKEVDEMGMEIDVDVNAYAGGGLAKPFPFKATIVPRSELHEEIMRRDWSQCTTVLGTLGDVDQKQMDDLDRMYTDIYGSK